MNTDNDQQWRPLAERMRPTSLDDVIGQDHLCSQGGLLRALVENNQMISHIFWGPPGCGKTTIGHLLAHLSHLDFVFFSAAIDGLKELKTIVTQAEESRRLESKGTLLFCDEIHRLNKNQQDAFLPHVESGLLVLLGATTENPSFEVNSALLSRCRVVTLKPLEQDKLVQIVQRALEKDALVRASGLELSDEVIELIARQSNSDARQALNLVESLIPYAPQKIDASSVLKLIEKPLHFDKKGEGHYNLISCLHKSVRASDVQAAAYYIVRMVQSGEDEKYLVRRMIRIALEDIGLADPQALVQAQAVRQAVEFVGPPESHLSLVHLAIYLASAPKSNSTYTAEKQLKKIVDQTGDLSPPMHLLNAPTSLMKEMGYGRGYQYDHDHPFHFSGTECLPDQIKGSVFYQPGDFGYEKEIARRIKWWQALKEKMSSS